MSAWPVPLENLSQSTKDQFLRGVVWELIFGGGSEAAFYAKMLDLLAAGAQWPDDDLVDLSPGDALANESSQAEVPNATGWSVQGQQPQHESAGAA